MVDKKITEMTELTTPAAADVVAIVDDPAGTPETKKITYSNIESNLSLTASQVSDFDTEVANNTDVTSNTTHRGLTNNPHSVTATQVNLGNVTNVATSDIAYDATTWNTNTDSATKNAIRDKVETMDTAIALNTAKNTNVSTDLSLGTLTATTIDVNSSDGTNVTLIEADTTNAGILGSDKWDEIVANTLKVTNATHTGDVTGDTTLTIGADKVLDSHINWGIGATQVNTADIPELTNLYYTEARVSSNTDVSSNTAARHTQNTDTALGVGAVAADHGTGTTDQIINVSYGTSATPPTASDTTEGSLYVQYTA